MSTHEQAMRIDSVGRARDQRAIILAVRNLQFKSILRLDDYYLINLIGKNFAQNVDCKSVP